MRQIIGVPIFWTNYEYSLRFLDYENNKENWKVALSSAISGMMFWVAAIPMDVVKS